MTHIEFPNVVGDVPNHLLSDILGNFEKVPERRQSTLCGLANGTTLLILAV